MHEQPYVSYDARISDRHWPGDFNGIIVIMPGLDIAMVLVIAIGSVDVTFTCPFLSIPVMVLNFPGGREQHVKLFCY
jgi:hypothetical protein